MLPRRRLLQEGGAAQRLGIGERGRALGGVEHELHRAVAHRVRRMRAPFRHLIDLLGLQPVGGQVALGPPRRQDLETERLQLAQGLDDFLLIGVAHGDEHGARGRRSRPRPELALGEGDFE